MTPGLLAATGAWSPARLAARAGLLAFGLLVAAGTDAASAEQTALASLLKFSDLRGYPSRTMPPPFGGSTLDARHFSLAEHRGTVIILNFWASWCLECRQEMLVLERLHRKLPARGFVVIGVNARETKDAVGRYARGLGLTFPLVIDPDGKINALYGVIGLPTTFVVGRDGRAVAVAIGLREWESPPARALIEALLAEPAPGTVVQ